MVIGIVLGFIITEYVSMNNLDNCFNGNIKNYYEKIHILMIIAIITFGLDIFGYFAMFI